MKRGLYRCANLGAYIHQAETRHRFLIILTPTGGKCACRTAWIDEELVHILEGVEAVSTAPAEDIDIQLIRLGKEQVGFVGDECKAFEEADTQRAVGDDLCQR